MDKARIIRRQAERTGLSPIRLGRGKSSQKLQRLVITHQLGGLAPNRTRKERRISPTG